MSPDCFIPVFARRFVLFGAYILVVIIRALQIFLDYEDVGDILGVAVGEI